MRPIACPRVSTAVGFGGKTKLVKADKNTKIPKETKPISFDKFVLEVKRGCAEPFITTGFTITGLPGIDNDFIVVHNTEWKPFALEEIMCNTAHAILDTTNVPSDLILVALPKVFTVKCGIDDPDTFNKVAGLLLSNKLIDVPGSKFSQDPESRPSAYVMAANTKIHFGRSKNGKILVKCCSGEPFGSVMELEDICYRKFLVTDDPNKGVTSHRNPEDFEFYDKSDVSEFSSLVTITHIAKVCCDMEHEIEELTQKNLVEPLKKNRG